MTTDITSRWESVRDQLRDGNFTVARIETIDGVPAFIVTRWGVMREFSSLDDLEAMAQRLRRSAPPPNRAEIRGLWFSEDREPTSKPPKAAP